MLDPPPRSLAEATALRQRLGGEVQREHDVLSLMKGRTFDGKDACLTAQRSLVQGIESQLKNVNAWIKGRNVAVSEDRAKGAKKRRAMVASAVDTEDVRDVLCAVLGIVERLKSHLTEDEGVLWRHARDVAKADDDDRP